MKTNWKDCVKLPERSTVEEYFKLPVDQYTMRKWYWPFSPWFRYPLGLVIEWPDFLNLKNRGGKEWEKWHAQIKTLFPVQYRVRRFCRSISDAAFDFIYSVRYELFYRIKILFVPENQNIRKHIPRTYSDFGDIIENILFANFVEYCENTNLIGEEYQNIKNIPDDVNAIFRDRYNLNKKYYNYIKKERFELKLKIEDLWNQYDQLELDNIDDRATFIQEKFWPLEKEIQDRDNEVLCYIVKERYVINNL